jgi:hypothetical protein
MGSGNTIKTTVRLPAELHWEFQRVRATRHLTNEQAFGDALASWIAHSPEPQRRKNGHSRQSVPVGPQERKYVESLLSILRGRDHPVRASALTAVLEALSAGADEEPVAGASPGRRKRGRRTPIG